MIGRRGVSRALPRSVWWQVAAGLLSIGTWVQPASADETTVASADRLRAVRLAEQAVEANKIGDSRESRRLLLRAVRWDPTRHRDYQQAIEGLSLVDPPAALRHAKLALLRDPRFGEDDPMLLLRLVATASEAGSWSTAAELARRHREVVFGQPKVSRRRRAEVELSVSRVEFLAGEIRRASEGFDRLRRLHYGLPANSPEDNPDWSWQFAANCHLAANHPDRAEEAIALLARQGGETAEVGLLRARLALVRGEPLAAIRHATRAIESPSPASAVDGYDVLIEAFVTANQTAQASDWLEEATQRDPEAVTPSLALVEVLTLLGSEREAWIESQRLVKQLLDTTEPHDPLFNEQPSDRSAIERRIDLAIAAELWLDTSVRLGEIEPVFKTLPSLSAKLDGLEPIAAALDRALDHPSFADASRVWLGTVSSRPDGALGLRRAGTSIALRLGDARAYETLVGSRIEEALRNPTNLSRLEHEVGSATAALANLSADHAGQRLLQRTIDRLADIAESPEGETAALLASLRIQLAEAIAGHLPDEPAKKHAKIDQAVALLRSVREAASQEVGLDHAELFVFSRCGRLDEAVEAGERAWRAGPSANRGEAESTLRCETGLLLEETLAARATPGDHERRVELLESILDEWPDHPETRLRLAAAFAERQQHPERAERMMRHVVRADPDLPAALALWADIRYRQGDEAEAAALLQRAIEAIDAGAPIEASEERAIRDRYAEVLATLGRAERAAAESPQ